MSDCRGMSINFQFASSESLLLFGIKLPRAEGGGGTSTVRHSLAVGAVDILPISNRELAGRFNMEKALTVFAGLIPRHPGKYSAVCSLNIASEHHSVVLFWPVIGENEDIEVSTMGNPVAEKTVFAAFLAAAPDFAGDAVQNWSQPKQDPPDVLCTTAAGRQVGLELTEWLDQGQIAEAKGMETIEESIRKAIRPEPPNNTEHIHFAWLLTLPRARVKPADAGMFRTELLQLVDEVDHRWDAEQFWQSPQGCWWTDFGRYPVLGKYLSQVHFFPRSAFRNWSSTKGGQHWLTFPMRGGAYSEDSMVAALQDRLADKIQKYVARPDGLDEFDLLVHYDLAWVYNSPVETLTFKFADAARAGTDFIGDDPGAFDRIFLFVPHNEAQAVFRLYPRGAGSR